MFRKIFFCAFVLVAVSSCQKHLPSHQHDAPGLYRQSVNQQMPLPFHLEQKNENSASSSNDLKLKLQPPVLNPPFPSRQVKQNVKR